MDAILKTGTDVGQTEVHAPNRSAAAPPLNAEDPSPSPHGPRFNMKSGALF